VSTPPSTARASSATPAPGKVRVTFVAQAGLVGAALAIYALVLSQAGLRHQDFDAYLQAAQNVWRGQPLYATFLSHPFPDPTLRPAYIYPPAFALLVAPLALVGSTLGSLLWLLIEQASLAAALLIVLRWRKPSSWALTVILCATLSFYPLWVDAVQGQANILVLLLVTIGMVGILQGRPAAGAALGIAAALKLTPLILLAWLLLERRFREAAWMLAACGGITAAAAALHPHDTQVYVSQVLPALFRGTTFYANQSLDGILGRIVTANPYTNPWLVIAWAPLLAVGAAGALLAYWFLTSRRHPLLARAAAFIPLLPLLSAVTWPHHLVIVLPLLWVAVLGLAARGWPAVPTLGLATLLVCFSIPRWPVGPGFGQPGFRAAQTADPLVFLSANALFFATLLLFLSAPWLLRAP
jgi:alpha-1,2-mannosyltransferase